MALGARVVDALCKARGLVSAARKLIALGGRTLRFRSFFAPTAMATASAMLSCARRGAEAEAGGGVGVAVSRDTRATELGLAASGRAGAGVTGAVAEGRREGPATAGVGAGRSGGPAGAAARGVRDTGRGALPPATAALCAEGGAALLGGVAAALLDASRRPGGGGGGPAVRSVGRTGVATVGDAAPDAAGAPPVDAMAD